MALRRIKQIEGGELGDLHLGLGRGHAGDLAPLSLMLAERFEDGGGDAPSAQTHSEDL